MNLQPWNLNGNLKGILGKNGIRNNLKNAPEAPHPFRELKRYPVHKLIHQLDLDVYDVPAPLDETPYVAKKVTLPLRQHVGAPAQPCVELGDTVEEGALVACIPEKALSANIHASISGTVTEVTGDYIVIQA
jgi:biotin carboxyl carrier protein